MSSFFGNSIFYNYVSNLHMHLHYNMYTPHFSHMQISLPKIKSKHLNAQGIVNGEPIKN